jgi:hypothetical protein
MLSWYLRVDESLLTTFLTPISMLGSDVPTDLGTLKGAVRKININDSTAADLSPDTQYSIKDSDFAVIDQARVRGAPRTSTCTLRRSSAVTIDRSIGPGWPTSLETEYEAGYSAAGTYATLGTDGKQSANAEVRHTDRLFPVFRRYAIPEFWDQKVTQEDGGTRYPVFLANDLNSLSARRICPREIELAPTLPFKEGFNYESLGSLSLPTAPVRISDGPHNRRAAFVLFKTPSWSSPGSAPYIQAEKIGVGAAVEQVNVNRPRHWTARVEIPHKDRAILLHVTGEPQHAIAFDDFTRLPVDEYLGRWSWRDALFTVCIYDEKYSEGVYPSDLEASFHVAGYKRELVIDAGDQYKLDYVVPGTVIGIDQTTRQPVRCTAGGWANDDRKILNARARQIYEYYGQTRRSLRLSTPIVNSQIGLGDYVVNFGSEHSVRSLGTTVSEVIVTIPSGTGANVPPPMIHYTTAFAELETIELLNRRPDPRELRGRAAALDAVRP